MGTLILTLSVIGIEVMMISASMSTGAGSPTLARNAMFSVVMIVLNGLVGLALVLGALRYREQSGQILQGAGVYLAMIASLSVLGLILPNFTVATSGPILSTTQGILLGLMSVGLYATFLFGQDDEAPRIFSRANAGGGRGGVSDPGGMRDSFCGACRFTRRCCFVTLCRWSFCRRSWRCRSITASACSARRPSWVDSSSPRWSCRPRP